MSSISPDCDCWFSKASMPSRIESRDREMWPSWELGSRFREIARWRSRSESFMWSARRYSCDGFAMLKVRWAHSECGLGSIGCEWNYFRCQGDGSRNVLPKYGVT